MGIQDKADDPIAYSTGIGVALGTALGAAFNNIAMGVALGVALGAAIGSSIKEKQEADELDHTPEDGDI